MDCPAGRDVLYDATVNATPAANYPLSDLLLADSNWHLTRDINFMIRQYATRIDTDLLWFIISEVIGRSSVRHVDELARRRVDAFQTLLTVLAVAAHQCHQMSRRGC